jgi:hypothetical protein
LLELAPSGSLRLVKAGARARQRGPFKDTKLGTFPIGASSLFVSSSTGFDEIDEFFSPPTRAMASNKEAKIGNRVITDEPMYLLFNVGMSENFVRPAFLSGKSWTGADFLLSSRVTSTWTTSYL